MLAKSPSGDDGDTRALRGHRGPNASQISLLLMVLGPLLTAACVDPLVSDVVPPRASLLLPPGSYVPPVTDDPILSAQIDDNDGLDGDFVPRRSAFAAGKAIHYWEFGEASQWAVPVFVIVKDDPDGTFVTPHGNFSKLPNHYNVIDAIPGDPNYSPFWTVTLVPITDKYQGEVLTSLDAIVEAERVGLVRSAIPLPMVANCPVALPHVRVEVGPETGDGTPVGPDDGYYRGIGVNYFNFGVAAHTEQMVHITDAFMLRRQGGEPLAESVRNMDMTNDGDLLDSNDLFAFEPTDEAYSGLVQVTDVVVPLGTKSIDTYQDATRSDFMDAAQLFTPEGAFEPAVVIAISPTEVVLNRPMQEPGY